MNTTTRLNTVRWLPFAVVVAALAGSPAAWANCCGDDGGFDLYGTNYATIADCILEYWLDPNHDIMGEEQCGCEEGHTPIVCSICCDEDLSVTWTKQCTASDGGSATVYTGLVYLDGAQAGTLTLNGFVIRPEGGCSGGGCSAAGGPQQGQSQAAAPYLDHRFLLGPGSGALRIKAAEPEIQLATPAGLDLVHGETDVDLVCQGAPPVARQIMSTSGLVDIHVESDSAYRLDFFHATDVNSELNAYGRYTIRSGRSPHATWRVFNPSGDTNDIDELVIAGGETGSTPQTNFYRHAFTPAPISKPWMKKSFWTLERGGIEQSVAISRDINPVIEHRAFLLSESGGEAVTTRSETWFAPTNTPHAIPVLLASVVDPDGLALETRWTYDTHAYPPRLLLVEYPDGNWERYEYDASGRRTARYAPLGNAWTNAPDSELRREVYGYASVDASDTGGWEWSDKPRTVTAYEAGIAASRTYHAYYYTAGGEKVEIEERAATPETPYGAAGNLRTKHTWYAQSETEPWSEEIRYVEQPGGLLETHVYETGNFDASSADPAAWSFTADPTGLWVRATADYGTTNSPGGIAYRTRREVSIRDAFDRPLFDETWLCIGETNYTRVAWVATTRDTLGRATAVRRSDGTLAETAWGCCGPESQTAAGGSVTETAYDALQRPVLTTRAGHGAQPDIFTETAYDAAGRATFSRTSSGCLSQVTTNAYDLAGRLTWSRNPDGIETTYLYDTNANTTIRGGLTNLSVRFADGRSHYTEQNGIRQQTYAYGVDSDGTQWTTVFTGPAAADSPAWSKTVTDPLGRSIAQIRPGFGDTLLITSNFYDTANHLVRTESSSAEGVYAATLFTYDSLGAPTLTAQDLDLDGEIDLSGPDRVSGSETSSESDASDDYWQVSRSWTYPDSGSDAALTNAITRTRLTGLGEAYSADGASDILTAESVSIGARGNATTSRTVVDRDNKTVYQVTDTPDSSVAALTVTVNGQVQSSRSTHDLTTTYAYDALGRQVATQDARGGMHSRGYDALGRVAWESDPATNGTWYAYDALGRRTAVTNALGQVTQTAYDAEGRTVAIWGATYPVAYEYDAHGRMVTMRTFRDEQGAGDETQWFYDEATGLLTNKVYADGKGTAYSYTSDGKLASRLWARDVTTSYAYTNGSSLVAIDYSDTTPDVAFQYDRLGRMTSAIVAGISTNAFTYDPETYALSVETQNGMEINRTTDALGRDTGFSLVGSDYVVTYGFDAYGRFHSVSSSVQSVATYTYLPGSDLVSGMSTSSGFLWTRAYESARSLITAVENRYGEAVVSRYDYANDELGRRTSRADRGLAFAAQPTYGDSATAEMPAYNAYSYNTRSEVTGAARRWGTPGASGDLVLGQQYAYAFDAIGNRITAEEGDTDRTANYTANALNQYTQRTVPDEKDLIGTVPTNVAVTVNQNPVSRQNAYWHHALEVDNATDAAFTQVAITAVYNPLGTNAPDVVTSQTGRVFVAETPEQFQYDDDGNLTQDGRFDYTWDAENRLIVVTTRDDIPASVPRVKVEYVYDHQFRRIASATAVWTNDAWQAAESRAFLYDGWNVVTELTHSQTHTLTNLYTWGLDLSGSLQGAGGIGGLLAGTFGGTTSVSTAFYCHDANGNVGQLVDADGALLAHYEYSPFGETVVSTGPLAKANTFRFSTKWFDNDTGLGYWGYRWYSPEMGRWPSRDPIEEAGGVNIYVALDNDLVNRVDMLGLVENSIDKPCCCCCPSRVYIVLEDTLQNGAVFYLRIDRNNVEVDPLAHPDVTPNGKCILDWEERVQRWISGKEQMRDSGWVDMRSRSSPTWNDWNDPSKHTASCPGEFPIIQLKDTPQFALLPEYIYATRWFKIGVRATPGCPCSAGGYQSEIKICARLFCKHINKQFNCHFSTVSCSSVPE
jgi:RHS repeat-associated protein